jgi:hypothetical protein
MVSEVSATERESVGHAWHRNPPISMSRNREANGAPAGVFVRHTAAPGGRTRGKPICKI